MEFFVVNVINTSCLSIRCLYCYFLVFQSYVLPITYGLPTIEDEDLALFHIYSLFPHLTIPLPLSVYNFSASTIPLIITSSFWLDIQICYLSYRIQNHQTGCFVRDQVFSSKNFIKSNLFDHGFSQSSWIRE